MTVFGTNILHLSFQNDITFLYTDILVGTIQLKKVKPTMVTDYRITIIYCQLAFLSLIGRLPTHRFAQITLIRNTDPGWIMSCVVPRQPEGVLRTVLRTFPLIDPTFFPGYPGSLLDICLSGDSSCMGFVAHMWTTVSSSKEGKKPAKKTFSLIMSLASKKLPQTPYK